ncbi:MAG: alpha/beta hydrolase [Deltaproteobacteria bacterium]|nr:alpha/beta hydrolase [Deltaproteobacteria bacterium]
MVDSVIAQGLRLALWDHAPTRTDLPLVLCVHGALDTGRSFDAIAGELEGKARVVAVDLRGHGSSDHVGVGGSYHLLDFLKDLAFVVDALKPISVLVGHSMGGNLALMLAGSVPSCTQALLLVDAVGPPGEEGSEQPERIGELLRTLLEPKRAFAPVKTIEEGIARMQKWNPGLKDAAAHLMLEPVLRDVDGGLEFPFDPRLRGPTPFRFSDDTWQAFARRVTAQTTIVRASDGFVPGGDVEGTLGDPFEARARLMKAKVVVVEGTHHLHVERPAALAQEILSLCKSSTD